MPVKKISGAEGFTADGTHSFFSFVDLCVDNEISKIIKYFPAYVAII